MSKLVADSWLRFSEPVLQARVAEIAQTHGVDCSTDDSMRLCYNSEEWANTGDPHLLALDEWFGPDWVAVYADDPEQRRERIAYLTQQGMPHVVWFGGIGTFVVLAKVYCPVGWEYS
jgi:hypothetical protein